MQIEKVTPELCRSRRSEIAEMIYRSMNFGCETVWYSREEALAKCDNLQHFAQQGSAIAFAAILDGSMEGFIWAYPCPDRLDADRVYISIVYINEKMRGHAIGSSLILAVEQEAAERGYRRLWLHTGADNSAAQHFYEKTGFIRERIQYQKEVGTSF